MRVRFYLDIVGLEARMEPECDRDNETLARIERECITKGCGRTQREDGSWRMLHVRIALEPRTTDPQE